MTDGPSTVVALACALLDVSARAEAANRLARHVGGTSLRIFVRDADLGVLVAVQGFPSGLPVGPEWQMFLSACRDPGIHHGDVPDGDPAELVPATAYVDDAGSVVVFVGSSLTLTPDELALPLLGALFRAEQKAWAASGQAAASAEAARHANALATALDRSRSDLEGAIQAKQQLLKDHEILLGIVGHDLRNPLNSVVMGSAMLIERGELPAAQLRIVQRIKSSSQRMARMIADLLDFERTRSGTIPITRKDCTLRDIVTQVVDEIEISQPTRTLEITADGEGRGCWDADRFAQVVSNLVGNALQHSPSDTMVTVSLHETTDRVVLEVVNVHKRALSEEELRRVFEPFRRGKESTGLGLGLYIVQQVARAHGGSVSARSDADRTTFSVELPRTDPT